MFGEFGDSGAYRGVVTSNRRGALVTQPGLAGAVRTTARTHSKSAPGIAAGFGCVLRVAFRNRPRRFQGRHSHRPHLLEYMSSRSPYTPRLRWRWRGRIHLPHSRGWDLAAGVSSGIGAIPHWPHFVPAVQGTSGSLTRLYVSAELPGGGLRWDSRRGEADVIFDREQPGLR